MVTRPSRRFHGACTHRTRGAVPNFHVQLEKPGLKQPDTATRRNIPAGPARTEISRRLPALLLRPGSLHVSVPLPFNAHGETRAKSHCASRPHAFLPLRSLRFLLFNFSADTSPPTDALFPHPSPIRARPQLRSNRPQFPHAPARRPRDAVTAPPPPSRAARSASSPRGPPGHSATTDACRKNRIHAETSWPPLSRSRSGRPGS